MPDNPRTKFQSLLRELFQLDAAGELDFGIYRIIGQKREVVEKFIDQELLDVIASELKTGSLKQESDVSGQLEELADKIREMLADDAIDAEGNLDEEHHKSKLGREYLALQKKSIGSQPAETREATIYNHLYHFFNRYYDKGDFMSLRRYSRREKYAIPYNGEEVYLHWANADQYYIKTGESFTDYRWKDPSGSVRVRFTVTRADIPKDNIKAPDKRFFIPQLKAVTVEKVGKAKAKDSYTLVTVPFHYRGLTEKEIKDWESKAIELEVPKTKTQDAMLVDATKKIPALTEVKKNKDAESALIAEKRKSSDGSPVSRLQHHLRRFTVKNTSDYFIHKDLGGFLTRELDFFLKNEVLNLDSLEAGGEARADGWFQLMGVIRNIGGKIIEFLAQLENFQKRLFEKKKFVTECHYCITLDRVPEELYSEIAKNKHQINEWKELFAIEEADGWSEKPTTSFLKKNKFISIDTRHFSNDFCEHLTNHIDQYDASLAFCSENLQALNLASSSLEKSVDPVYIDPPYNTGDDDNFPYKDNYQRSSWLCLLNDRLKAVGKLLSDTGTIAISIDDDELSRLVELGENIFGKQLATLVWDRNRKNDAKFFSVGHEYMCVFARDEKRIKELKLVFREPRDGLEDAKKIFGKLRKKNEDDWSKVREGWLYWLDDMLLSDPRRRMRRFTKVNERGPYRDDGNPSWPGGGGPRYEILHPTTKTKVVIPSRGWVWPTPERFWEEHAKGRIIFGVDHTTIPGVASYLFESDGQVMPSVHYSYAQTASQEFKALWGKKIFENPKNWRDLARLIRYLGKEDGCVLDCFAGSGTTAHSVINLNREDGGTRRYVVVEMAKHFHSVVVPRIKKVAYSDIWSKGSPKSRSRGRSHCLKYFEVESYDDSLANIAFTENENAQKQFSFDEYCINYMLEFETSESETLLNIEKLSSPFDYTLEIRDGEESCFKKVDLPETFNFLIGLRVQTRKVFWRGTGKNKVKYLVLKGRTNPHATGGEREVVVVWRTTKDWKKADFEADKTFIEENKLNKDADEVFVNCDSFVKNANSLDPVFKRRMFNEE